MRSKLLTPVFLLLCAITAPSAAQVVPAKTWFSPSQPLVLENAGDEDVRTRVSTFDGEPVGETSLRIRAGRSADLADVLPPMAVGCYRVDFVAEDLETPIASPLVLQVLGDNRPEAAPGPNAVRIVPLEYARVTMADGGSMTFAFYYDVAPHTVDNFLRLARGGFYDGLTFHRVIPGFVIQGGDPLGDSTGGPGYAIDAEFNDKPHLPGVLSMAREGDPLEAQGAMPRDRARNSAGSQFFVCLDYENTARLDGRYTVFGRVVDGMEQVEAIAATPIADEALGRPANPPTMESVEIRPVTPDDDPYATLRELEAEPTTQPATRPAAE